MDDVPNRSAFRDYSMPNSNRYSNYSSSFSNSSENAQSRHMYKFTKKPSFTDESTSMTIANNLKDEKDKPDMELFLRYEREVQNEKRLINKVCQDRDLSDLILNLNQFK